MRDPVLENLVKRSIATLTREFGYCGAALGENVAMLNSTDHDGNEIRIKVEVLVRDEDAQHNDSN